MDTGIIQGGGGGGGNKGALSLKIKLSIEFLVSIPLGRVESGLLKYIIAVVITLCHLVIAISTGTGTVLDLSWLI